jgi:hypothetical protein
METLGKVVRPPRFERGTFGFGVQDGSKNNSAAQVAGFKSNLFATFRRQHRPKASAISRDGRGALSPMLAPIVGPSHRLDSAAACPRLSCRGLRHRRDALSGSRLAPLERRSSLRRPRCSSGDRRPGDAPGLRTRDSCTSDRFRIRLESRRRRTDNRAGARL